MKKLLFITGGSKGIGRATVETFLANGYHVVNFSRSALDLEGVTQIRVDMSNLTWVEDCSDQVTKLAESAESICVIHNAAVLYKDSVRDLDALRLQQVLQLNVIAALQLNQLLLPSMKGGSSIIYVGSTLSEKAVAGSCSYVTSKHAVVGLMRSTAQDLAGSGIHTTCVCPGFTDTEMLREHLGHDQTILDAIAGGVTQGRLIQPQEIADTLWFASQNAVINGAVLHANLGQIEH
ncbi:NAD(P)-dependent dehydrogenase (short-subunit alcohol dehydrogenase family) [Litorivivens lipolytica]|uniref:NAD(P)-dependent dehydrogenase (Short-subunit alcohol dehydrogenase family) n=1 Tax=Litorivivens lipolytica TaxID=1524264 RepID=A0A7W4Z508_9GAMM|nr:SDR family oxidoreductase [Litorivivens lipolytica]MBB3046698.1 NAD(P)-dependent dehydrogenase (short-subunit alcohol dehydrogenase family) [Litorivivens lipolytica]